MKWKIGNVLHAGMKYGLLVSLGAVSCAAGLTETERRRVEDFESIHGFSLARMSFNLLGGDGGTLNSAVNRDIDPFGLWITAQISLLSIHENCSVQDPFSGPDKKLGEVNYLNYKVGFSSFSLVPSGAGEAKNPRPFEITTPNVANFIPLVKQKQIKNAAITYNSRFCSPENLKALNNAADEIIGAFSANFGKDKVLRLFQNFLYQHILYVSGRLIPEASTQMQTAMLVVCLVGCGGLPNFLSTDPSQLCSTLRPFHVFLAGSWLAGETTGLIPRDHTHTGEFAPHIIALFNLAQSFKILSTFLGVHPLSTLKELMLDEADTSARDLISTYEIMVAEVIEYLKNLDNSFFELLFPR
ncbi:MAG: hypothetical protein LBB11_03345, partial [Puniceicoccales bacterium]|jgi:hypothetical protein|nr:hypothetical protein [Puniceicoccales bacterium]